MKTITRYNGTILMTLVLLLLASCRPEVPVETIDNGVPVYPVVYSSASSYSDTRALPATGWTEYSASVEYQRVPTSIQSFFDHPTRARSGVFSYDVDNHSWISSVRIDPDNQMKYTVFGYMPSTLTGTLTKDAGTGVYTMAFTNLNPVSKEDFMVIVGVGRTANAGTDDDVTLNNHSYEGKDGTQGNENNLVLMVDHMYAGVDFQFKLDEQYSQLRTIKISKITLSTPSTNYLNGSVTFTPTTTGNVTNYSMSEPVYTEVTPQSPTDIPEEVNIVLNPPLTLTTDYQPVHGYLVPVDQNKLVNGRYELSMTTEYEVYDKGTPEVFLSARSATNAVTLSPPDGQTSLNRGTKYVLQSIVAPTYLYQLSDNDLNNPTISITQP